jgi:ABC-type proline/glycine betaine transport system substrate-binding protein
MAASADADTAGAADVAATRAGGAAAGCEGGAGGGAAVSRQWRRQRLTEQLVKLVQPASTLMCDQAVTDICNFTCRSSMAF